MHHTVLMPIPRDHDVHDHVSLLLIIGPINDFERRGGSSPK